MTVLLLLTMGLIIARLAYMQILRGSEYRAEANGQRTSVNKLLPKRGEIFISDRISGKPYTVATSIEKPLVYAVPPQIVDAESTATKLSEILGMDKAVVLEKFSDKNKKYVPIKKLLTDDEQKRIEDLKLPGIAFDYETIRFYPEGRFMSQLLGYVGYKDSERTGLYGLEQAFEDELHGQEGKLSQERDVFGAWIFGGLRDKNPAIDGDDLVLTIDKATQFKAESVLKETVDKHQADSGSILVMDPKTGAIMAMASYPTFDPNQYAKVEDPAVFTNINTVANYEPGSIFKAITVAAAINEGKISSSTTYNDLGSVEVDGHKIMNSDKKAHGTVTISQILEESLNTGTIFAKDSIGNKKFREYLTRFGFGEKTGVEVAETKGDLANLQDNIMTNYHTASFGQGINVTPIQMAQAYSALANGGKMMKPYLIASRISHSGGVTETKPAVVAEVVSPETASTVSAMLVNVVEKGHGKRAQVPGYYVAGKTGTAQVAKKEGGGYEENNNIGSFIGYAPVEDPRFVMIVRINHPRTVSFAESTAAPAFGQMAAFLLQHLGVAPTRQ